MFFLNMPFSALIENEIFCMHSGLKSDLEKIDQARLTFSSELTK